MRLRLLRPAVLACLLLAGPRLGAAETLSDARSPAASEARLKRDITYLASDELEGRGVTTRGVDLAADYVAAEFKKAGLKPAGEGGSYFQPFSMAGAVLMEPAKLRLRGPSGQRVQLKPGTQFQPLGLSGSGQVSGPLVFVGYGITSTDPEKGPVIDEYADLDVSGKVVVVLRDTPRADNKESIGPAWRRKYSSLTEKLNNAAAHKAAAVLFVNDRDTAKDGDDLLNFGYYAAGSAVLRMPDLPVLHVRRSVVEGLMHESLEGVERDIDRDLKPRSRELTGWAATADVSVWRAKNALKLKNVVGVLEGSGKLADETIVIGAHYDHLGYGGSGSLSPSKKMAVHHGADDNGSGTTALMELARRFGSAPGREGRRLVFIAFSAEESGLFGSEAYCKEPLFPLESTAAMINLDMVGRLAKDKDTGKDRLTVYGTGTAKTFDGLIEALNKKYDFQLKKVATGMGPSDQMSFYVKKVPVFFFFTNDHPDYHRPTDTADKINVPGMRRVVDLTDELAAYLATVSERPEYVKVAGPSLSPGATGPRLGIMPDYGDDGEGVLLGGVSEGGPAQKAGLKEGDRIVEIAGQPVKNLEGYMVLMRTHKNGDTIDVAVVRNREKKVFKVKLE
jgi:hypothetical protein